MNTDKYQQAMEQVNLSPEADQRIQAAIEAAQQEQKVVSLSGGRAKKSVFRFGRTAVIAAVLAGLLTITAMAVSYYRSLGEVNDVLVLYETGPKHELTIRKAFASPDAPETIQEYYLPTVYITDNVLKTFWVEYIAKDENGEYDFGYLYEPTNPDPARRDKENPLLYTPTDVCYGWGSDSEGGSSVHFLQRVARLFDDGDVLVSHATGDFPTDFYSFELDGYELYAFALLADDGSGKELSRTWYWTDGDYLFELTCYNTISDEAMEEIFHSIRPVGGEIPYLAEFE